MTSAICLRFDMSIVPNHPFFPYGKAPSGHANHDRAAYNMQQHNPEDVQMYLHSQA